ncbi:RsmF rRNA methyltransferase first C-terminal domain-containing protein [Lactobacillus sp. ESL0731]|uniref:RsmB/NOP family class I SAM-dependent RNA methyltransferase n=1 Tax=unclassified Lactobacillus TaxID=2620435 RepID=UPI0023F9BDCD|nr:MULTISPECIES: RsmB/NOP family class I SAM-dependent RNA methyltransferase [unclassified Lactobacillus]WEV50301.1 RsmF rRNA methyltransferase first C-terminal domain-containing protein [Lactobacillus sp. ESL0700]WEV61430.1 RsmF rRNA methyltransferase first C-terminal domain-containing protein [Lactobacillus sp. ESL0731]
MLNLPAEFTNKYQKLLGQEQAAIMFKAMAEPSKKAFRLNPLKFNQQVSYNCEQPVPEINAAYYGQVAGNDPEWVSGTVYSQDPSAMFPATLMKINPGDKVLDLCAAPGGKSTALGEQLAGSGLLVANEISATRAKILRENIERWGITNCLITSEDPANLAPQFPQFFDKILVDAPCSGEGMFRKNPDAVNYWSQDYVLVCQKRQQEILTQAVKMLKPGGELVYSTCTYAPEEDEQIVSWLINEFGFSVIASGLYSAKISHGRPEWADNNPALKGTLRFWPQDDLGEGQFAAKLKLPGNSEQKQTKDKKHKKTRAKMLLTKEQTELVTAVLDKFNLPQPLANWRQEIRVSHDHVFLPAIKAANLHLKVINNGLELGVLKKNRFEPGHQLAMALSQVQQDRVVELNRDDYAAYLHGETVRVKTDLRGFVLVSARQLIFSFGKVTGNGVLKNFYPKGLRTLKKG